ncbi:sporulation integral membrane protein YlbJ [Clostridiaceae bacterium 35-E11]
MVGIVFAWYILKKNLLLLKIKQLCIILIVCFLVFNIIRYPQQTFDAAKAGVDTWFSVVLPALLPFFIGAELLIKLGVVHFIGILLEPIVRPIFNVPGQGSFILAMSVTSGYPMGVKLVTQLRNEGVFHKIEAQRLISFCSTSGPLFMIGAVAIGMFHNPQLGSIIAFSHYLGAIATGVIFRFYKFKHKSLNHYPSKKKYFSRAFSEMFRSIQSNEKSLGDLLGTSVKNSIETLLVIGGFIILFSVIIQLLTLIGFIDVIAMFLENFLLHFDIKKAAYPAIISGIFEVTIGCKLLSEIPKIPFIQQAIFGTMLISWSGFSIHAQAASFIAKTDLSVGIYLFSKLLHAILSSIFVVLILPVSTFIFNFIHVPVFSNNTSPAIKFSWLTKFSFSSKIFISITLFSILAAILLQMIFFFLYMIVHLHKK